MNEILIKKCYRYLYEILGNLISDIVASLILAIIYTPFVYAPVLYISRKFGVDIRIFLTFCIMYTIILIGKMINLDKSK